MSAVAAGAHAATVAFLCLAGTQCWSAWAGAAVTAAAPSAALVATARTANALRSKDWFMGFLHADRGPGITGRRSTAQRPATGWGYVEVVIHDYGGWCRERSVAC